MGFNFDVRKYRNKKVSVNGIVFDSQKEASRYWELWIMQSQGVIKDLRTQVKYVLLPSQKGEVRTERPVAYIADFVYYDNEKGKEIVEDAKGYRTKEYIIKRKLMKYIHNIEVVEV